MIWFEKRAMWLPVEDEEVARRWLRLLRMQKDGTQKRPSS